MATQCLEKIKKEIKKVTIFGITANDDKHSGKWQTYDLIKVITRNNVIKCKMSSQTEKRKLYTCELHYREHCKFKKMLIHMLYYIEHIKGALSSL